MIITPEQEKWGITLLGLFMGYIIYLIFKK